MNNLEHFIEKLESSSKKISEQYIQKSRNYLYSSSNFKDMCSQ